MTGRHMLLKAEAVEKLFLHNSPRAHHLQNLPIDREN
jgi:hypothetical protein